MAGQRKSDSLELRYLYRSDRVFEDAGRWFFHTREGTIEGPFVNQVGAHHRINVYIQIMTPHGLPASARIGHVDVRSATHGGENAVDADWTELGS